MANRRHPERERLFQAILSLRNAEDCDKFFEDICTIKELDDIAQRLRVAELLDREVSYAEITRQTGASTTTISRVNRCLVYGSGGYRAVLDALKGERKNGA